VIDSPTRDGRLSGLETLAPWLSREQVIRGRKSLAAFEDSQTHRIALLVLAFDWPELGVEQADAEVERLLDRYAGWLDGSTFSQVHARVRPGRQGAVTQWALQWWLGRIDRFNEDEAANALRALWPSALSLDDCRRIGAAARSDRWSAEQLTAALQDTPCAASVDDDDIPPPPGYEDAMAQLSQERAERMARSRDPETVRQWLDYVTKRSDVDLRIGVNDILDQLHTYPPSLRTDCLEGIAHALGDPTARGFRAQSPRTWFLANVHRIALWIYDLEGVEGLSALFHALGESGETFA
jgi:hypothetical protein